MADAFAMPDPITRLNAALEGRYGIERELGEGGMATVYLAEDIKHERKVALKVLKPELAAVVGAERFLAEIKTTAKLTHPHILPLHDSGEADSFVFYVMPHVEGESLRQRLDRELQLPVDDAVRIATNVAEALDYAHQQGVIHRDIKPANVLLQAGKPVISDFGIALAVGVAGGGRLTETGLSLGTPHYMSPEQATGDQHVGPATDIYALGCVLYEMLVGEPPFTGSTPQAILGKIIAGEPASATNQRASVPPNVDAAIRKALEKVPADRFTSAQGMVDALADSSFQHGESPEGGVFAGAGPWKRLSMALLTTTAVLAIALGWTLLRSDSPTPVGRYRIAVPEDQALRGTFALSPNGSAWVYVGPGERGNQLWLKRRSEHPRPLLGTDGAAFPFFSPDGAWVGFAVGPELRKIPIGGGESITLADSAAVQAGTNTFRAAWLDDGSIVFPALGRSVLRVPDTGGQTERVLAVGDIPELAYGVGVAPLPNGRGVLVDVCDPGCGVWGVWTVDLETGVAQSLIPGGRGAWYVPTGHVLYGDGSGTLFAVPFDVETLALVGPAVPVLEGVAGRYPAIAASDSGDLLYVEGVGGEALQLVWVERDGTAQVIDPSWTGQFASLALSPDGTRLAVSIAGAGGEDLWIKQLDRGPLVRLTTTDGLDRRPAWTPDGLSVTFASDRGEVRSLYVTRADGVGTTEQVLDLGFAVDEGFWSAQGDWLIYRTGVTGGERDIFAWRSGPDSVTVPVVGQAGSDEHSPALSSDGRYLAYVSNQSGQYEVYVRPFPDVQATQFKISLEGGDAPVWAHSGRELFYVSQGNLMVTEIVTSPTFSAGPGRALFPVEGYITSNLHARYDVTADDQHFVIVRRGDSTQEGGLILVQNFFEELKERVGN